MYLNFMNYGIHHFVIVIKKTLFVALQGTLIYIVIFYITLILNNRLTFEYLFKINK